MSFKFKAKIAKKERTYMMVERIALEELVNYLKPDDCELLIDALQPVFDDSGLCNPLILKTTRALKLKHDPELVLKNLLLDFSIAQIGINGIPLISRGNHLSLIHI